MGEQHPVQPDQWLVPSPGGFTVWPGLIGGGATSLRAPSVERLNVQDATFFGPTIAHPAITRAYRPPTAIVVSYPRAGRTWLRAVLAHAFEEIVGPRSAHPMDTTGWTRIEQRLPRMILTHGRDNPRRLTPREIPTDISWVRDQRVILLVRDPRDVLLSLYHEATKRSQAMRGRGWQGSLAEALRADHGGLRTIVAFYNVWARQRQVPAQMLLVKYEHARADPALETGRLLGWLGLDAAPETVRRIADAASFDSLRRQELSGRLGYTPKPGMADDPDTLIMRRGVVGAYRDAFTAEDHAYADEVLAGMDEWFGYSKAHST